MILLASVVVSTFLSFPETAAAVNKLLTSPLFGNPLGGDPFDDGTTSLIPQVDHLRSISICYGDVIDGIQLLYILQDNSTFIGLPHGRINKECPKDSKLRTIVFKEGERLVQVEGSVQKTWQYISQLTLFTSVNGGPPKLRGGPFGNRGDNPDVPFSLTGDIRGIFGRSGDVLDSLGFYMNTSLPLHTYNKTDLVGGEDGEYFDDFESLLSNGSAEIPLKITNMVISYGSFINGIQVTYMTSMAEGTSITLTHGTLDRQNYLGHSDLAVLEFEADEWVTRINISSRVLSLPMEGVHRYLNYLQIETTNSVGSVRSYGPFGAVVSTENVTTVVGVVHGFYGRFTKKKALNALGFYI